MDRQNKEAFTLIELSISLVIIGLIVGGILGARDLIRQAELRSVMTDISGYKSAINTFNLKYNALPGDMLNATAYWSGTGNGNANGSITSAEGMRGWQHLGLSGMIPGNYSGANNAPPVLQTDVPVSAIDGAGYSIFTPGGGPAIGRNILRFGTPAGTSPTTSGSVVSPPDAKAIDDKMDDGLPGRGKVRVTGGYDGSSVDADCVDGTDPNTTYELDQTEPQCEVQFLLNFQ